MRKLLTVVLAGGISLALHAQAPDETARPATAWENFRTESESVAPVVESSSGPHRLSAKLLFVDYGTATQTGNTVSNGIDLAYQYRLNSLITLAAPIKLGLLHLPEQTGVRQPFLGVDATAQVGQDFFKERLRGYVTGGFGIVGEPNRGSNVQFPVGAGVAVRISEAASITAQYEFRPSSLASRKNSQIGVGILFDFGRGKYNPKYWDTDGDGVTDDIDACISIAGLSRHEGCPDTDKDGLHDELDPCPLYYASPGEGGCPDEDGDGVPDPKDKCPNESGDLVHVGCPPLDSDKDGFADEIDECPGSPGKHLGCPDADADGLADDADGCPKQAGPKSTNGCPDRDDDGVADMNDNCPLTPGKLNGCPDRDGDGVDDGTDRCPNIAGESAYDGCPEIMSTERNMFEYAVRAIAFEGASTVIDTRGYENLTGLAEIMTRYPEYRVKLTGHADFEELVTDRTSFSEQRARACASFLESKGIAKGRIGIDGLGAGRPVVREGTEAARAVNRRVEIDLYEAE